MRGARVLPGETGEKGLSAVGCVVTVMDGLPVCVLSGETQHYRNIRKGGKQRRDDKQGGKENMGLGVRDKEVRKGKEARKGLDKERGDKEQQAEPISCQEQTVAVTVTALDSCETRRLVRLVSDVAPSRPITEQLLHQQQGGSVIGILKAVIRRSRTFLHITASHKNTLKQSDKHPAVGEVFKTSVGNKIKPDEDRRRHEEICRERRSNFCVNISSWESAEKMLRSNAEERRRNSLKETQ
ncbi:hypothetical protein F7725_021329 [Dissostichus mawsoni]|uniref:Uncharacterized protein n=1 Tax=Dissostichus mawsoni TaxID=36200 RepID=A0A7J5YH68_DISMA|nr:hypothetical protein F7725_021329 [Dissostichus mawsoni]